MQYRNDKDMFVVGLFGFGLVIARSEKFKANYNILRKTNNKTTWFVTPWTA